MDSNINKTNKTIFDTQKIQNYKTTVEELANSGKLNPLYLFFGSRKSRDRNMAEKRQLLCDLMMITPETVFSIIS